MRKMKLLVLPLLLALIAGCGGGGGGSSQPQHAPTISNLYYSPASTSTVTTTVTGSITFNDLDGNISTFTLNINVQNGPQVGSTTIPIPGVSGITS